jgi:hypothetical protein
MEKHFSICHFSHAKFIHVENLNHICWHSQKVFNIQLLTTQQWKKRYTHTGNSVETLIIITVVKNLEVSPQMIIINNQRGRNEYGKLFAQSSY